MTNEKFHVEIHLAYGSKLHVDLLVAVGCHIFSSAEFGLFLFDCILITITWICVTYWAEIHMIASSAKTTSSTEILFDRRRGYFG